jgi:hypothetical protein
VPFKNFGKILKHLKFVLDEELVVMDEKEFVTNLIFMDPCIVV